jgi:hypothetical protein
MEISKGNKKKLKDFGIDEFFLMEISKGNKKKLIKTD